jgi:hypothetical protein
MRSTRRERDCRCTGAGWDGCHKPPPEPAPPIATPVYDALMSGSETAMYGFEAALGVDALFGRGARSLEMLVLSEQFKTRPVFIQQPAPKELGYARALA